MPKKPSAELVPASSGFNYAACDAKLAEKLRITAEQIRETVRKTVEDIIEVGNALTAVKDSLEHGQFGQWLKAEFERSRRTASHYMAIADQFGAKMAIIAILTLQPTAAYLLAASSILHETREVAIERPKVASRSPRGHPPRFWPTPRSDCLRHQLLVPLLGKFTTPNSPDNPTNAIVLS